MEWNEWSMIKVLLEYNKLCTIQDYDVMHQLLKKWIKDNTPKGNILWDRTFEDEPENVYDNIFDIDWVMCLPSQEDLNLFKLTFSEIQDLRIKIDDQSVS